MTAGACWRGLSTALVRDPTSASIFGGRWFFFSVGAWPACISGSSPWWLCFFLIYCLLLFPSVQLCLSLTAARG